MNDLKKKLGSFKREATKILARLSKDRDDLRNLLGDYQDILDSADAGAEDFEAGLDKLSELL